MSSIHTSVIVLTYRRVPALLAVLRALAQQADAGTEILVADDGSPAADVDAVMNAAPRTAGPLWHVWHPDTGFTAARARNLAAARARGNYLIFLDGDCVPAAGLLRQHAALARPGHFVNGSRILLNAGLTARVEAGEVDVVSAGLLIKLAWRLTGGMNKWLPEVALPLGLARASVWREFRWKGIRSCNFGLWRGDYERVNGFDESFQGWGHEDADLVLRLHNAGLVRVNGGWATEVYHLWHRENTRNSEQKNRQTVLERASTRIVEAAVGLKQHTDDRDVVFTRLA